jgi:hypothetical protein
LWRKSDRLLGCAAAGEVQAKYPHALFGLVGNLTKSCAYCGANGCFRACLEHLEARGLLDKRFVNQYRASQGKASGRPAGQKAVRQAGGEEVYTE